METFTRECSRSGANLEAVKGVLSEIDPNIALQMAVEYGQHAIIQLLLTHCSFSEEAAADAMSRAATRYDDCRIIDMFLQDPRFDPTWRDNEAIEVAFRNDADYIVLRLLREPRVTASLRSHVAITCAARDGKLYLVDYLLTYCPLLDPSTGGDNTPLNMAASNGHFEVVDLLLLHPKVQQGNLAELMDYYSWEEIQQKMRKPHVPAWKKYIPKNP
jgi:hypothetical protein